MRCNAMRYTALHCTAMQCNELVFLRTLSWGCHVPHHRPLGVARSLHEVDFPSLTNYLGVEWLANWIQLCMALI